MQFDARAAKLLKSGEHLTYEGCPGLRLEATDTRRTWTYRYKSPITSGMKQVRIGHWPAVSAARAEADWERLREFRDVGRCPATERREERARAAAAPKIEARAYLVRDLVHDYIEEHLKPHRKQKGAEEMERLLTRELGAIDDLDASTVTRKQAFALLQALAKRGPVVAGQLRGELGAAWEHALDADRIPSETPNWWRQILRNKLRSKGKKINGEHIGVVKRALKDPEVGLLINWLPNFSRLLHDVLVVYLWTCTRGAESVAIEKEEVTEEADGLWWTVPKRKTKNARIPDATDLRVPLVGRAAEVVRRRMAAVEDGYIFPSRTREGVKTHVQQKTIQTAVYYHQPYSETRPDSIRPRLPVTHWSPHDLRRTGRTLVAAMGCPREVGEALLGHILPGVEGTYNLHAYDRERREWLTRLDERLEQLARAHPLR